MPILAPAWPTVVMPVRMGNWPVMKFAAPSGATGLGVVIGEEHPFFGQLVEMRRLPGHQAPMVGADVPHADVVAHDDDDVGFLGVGGVCSAAGKWTANRR